jgi:hypothetical protein
MAASRSGAKLREINGSNVRSAKSSDGVALSSGPIC